MMQTAADGATDVMELAYWWSNSIQLRWMLWAMCHGSGDDEADDSAAEFDWVMKVPPCLAVFMRASVRACLRCMCASVCAMHVRSCVLRMSSGVCYACPLVCACALWKCACCFLSWPCPWLFCLYIFIFSLRCLLSFSPHVEDRVWGVHALKHAWMWGALRMRAPYMGQDVFPPECSSEVTDLCTAGARTAPQNIGEPHLPGHGTAPVGCCTAGSSGLRQPSGSPPSLPHAVHARGGGSQPLA